MNIGSHYDHLGVRIGCINSDTIFNGARVTTLIETRHFAHEPPKRSVIFVCFTGEEIGYLGSDYFTCHLPISFSQIVFNFNIDNVGYNNIS